MLISEIYRSLQGEGLLTGTPSVFVRTSGCNLRCEFCDTPFASWNPTGDKLEIEDIVHRVSEVAEDAAHVVLTGGEPMLPREIKTLCAEISRAGFHITIETAGTIFHELECDLISVSPKLSNSDPSESRAGEWLAKHQQTRHRPEIVRQLMNQYEYQLKFVVDTPTDFEEIDQYLEQVQPYDLSRVLMMPQGTEMNELEQRAQWLRPYCEDRGFVYCPRKHIEWYGNKRGT